MYSIVVVRFAANTGRIDHTYVHDFEGNDSAAAFGEYARDEGYPIRLPMGYGYTDPAGFAILGMIAVCRGHNDAVRVAGCIDQAIVMSGIIYNDYKDTIKDAG